MTRLDEVKARLAAADGCHWALDPLGTSKSALDLIAHAPSDLVALVAEVRRLRVERDEARAALTVSRATADAYRANVAELRDALIDATGCPDACDADPEEGCPDCELLAATRTT